MEPLVSVCIWTYNQEKYTRACVEGALKQRTTFRIEVIVGNDCSTDRTKEILDELASLYPERLVVINRPVNIGGHENSMDVIARARGEFVALCDGDDFWIDENKLQKQHDSLKLHPNVDLCFHPAKEYYNDKFHALINAYHDAETIVPLERVIMGRGGFMSTSSLLIRKSSIFPFPDWFIKRAPVGDAFLQALGSARGGALYLPDAMSAYRRFSVGSMTEQNIYPKQKARDVQLKMDSYIYCYNSLGVDTDIKPTLRVTLFEMLNNVVLSDDRLALKQLIDQYRDYLVPLTGKLRLLERASCSNAAFMVYRGILWLRRRLMLITP